LQSTDPEGSSAQAIRRAVSPWAFKSGHSNEIIALAFLPVAASDPQPAARLAKAIRQRASILFMRRSPCNPAILVASHAFSQ
jgi:hypothetical protein